MAAQPAPNTVEHAMPEFLDHNEQPSGMRRPALHGDEILRINRGSHQRLIVTDESRPT